jgi:hypothetical protein
VEHTAEHTAEHTQKCSLYQRKRDDTRRGGRGGAEAGYNLLGDDRPVEMMHDENKVGLDFFGGGKLGGGGGVHTHSVLKDALKGVHSGAVPVAGDDLAKAAPRLRTSCVRERAATNTLLLVLRRGKTREE